MSGNPYSITSAVFVYGTLRKGESNDITLLAPEPQFIGNATVCGTLFNLGRYPGIILGGTEPVVGEVWGISRALELKLDEIEMLYPTATDEYRKRDLPVLCNGSLIDCIVYEINPSYTVNKPVIAHGDWVKRNS
jgi:gamma-glutamylcyclotransferase (GGCT)/AIG2-like uncharacterized protein YtfP